MTTFESISDHSASGAIPEFAELDADSALTRLSPGIVDRMRLVQEHRLKAYRESNATRAVLCGVNSDLAEIEAHLGEALRQELAACPANIEEIERHRPSIDLILRLSKQIAQITQVDQQVAKNETNGDTEPK